MAKEAVETKKDPNLNAVEGFNVALALLTSSFSDGLRSLLETKHLYQRAVVPFQDLISQAQDRVISGYRTEFNRYVQRLTKTAVIVTTRELFLAERDGSRQAVLQAILPNVKLFCQKCARREAFKLIWWTDVANEVKKPLSEPVVADVAATFQMWLLVLRCQSCLGPLEGFLVRRDEWKLSLEGRSPIENVELPTFLPKTELQWFRDAVVAQNSGKVLAALFYLRTFIEQFARRQAKMDGKVTGGEIMTAYNGLLPEAQRSFMPSLKACYEDLSAALHGANEDGALFESARAQIERHFDFRRIYNIVEVPKD